jgi:hypothetical protein
MSIQKKSLISTLKSAKKANVASATIHEADAKGAKATSMRLLKGNAATSMRVLKNAGVSFKSMKKS